ncbi:MAG TPA: hypothetical protein VGQ87_02385 [Patescibacteria group bacterium]|jgi:hypothetical protein|nr:hypothetical protein [Patescibacteria group bacterium]
MNDTSRAGRSSFGSELTLAPPAEDARLLLLAAYILLMDVREGLA